MQSQLIQRSNHQQVNPQLQTYRNFTSAKKNHNSYYKTIDNKIENRSILTQKKNLQQISNTKSQNLRHINDLKSHNIDSTYIDGFSQSKSHIKTNNKNKNIIFNDDNSTFVNKIIMKTKQRCLSQKKSSCSTLSVFPQHLYNNNKNNTILQSVNCLRHKPLFQSSQNKPIINTLPFSIYPQKYYQNNNKLFISKQQRFQNIIQDMRYKYLNRLQQKIHKDKEIFQNMCTFMPNKQKYQIGCQYNPQLKFQELYNEAKIIEDKKRMNQQMKMQKEKMQVKQFKEVEENRIEQTHKRCMKLLNVQKHKHIIEKPLYQRINQTNNQRKQLLEYLKCKYSPEKQKQTKHLSSKLSQQLAKRLTNDYLQQKAQRKYKLQQKIQILFRKNNTFKPQLSKNQLFSNQKPQKSLHHLQKSKSVEQHTFKPQINTVSKLIANYLQNHNPQLYPQSWSRSQKFNQRLYEGNYLTKVNNLSKIQQQLYQQCTFQPQINQISKQLFYLGSISEPNQIPKHRCPLPDYIINQQKQLTFQPQINLKSKFMQKQQKQITIKKNQQKSKEKLEKYQYLKEYKELQQCTFKPYTISTTEQWDKWKKNNLKKIKMNTDKRNLSHKENDISCQVKGLDSFIKNCNRIKKKKIQVIQRTQQIFNFQKKYDQRMKKQKYNKK